MSTKHMLMIGSVALSVAGCGPPTYAPARYINQIETNPEIIRVRAQVECVRSDLERLERCFPRTDLRPTRSDQELLKRSIENFAQKSNLELATLFKSLEPTPETSARLERERTAEQELLGTYLPSDVLECNVMGNMVFGFIGAKKMARNDCLEARRLRTNGS